MAPECTFIFANGLNCRCAATRNQEFCRHHAPKPAPSPAPAAPAQPRLRSGSSIFTPDLRAAMHAVIRNPDRRAFDDLLVAFAKDGWVPAEDVPRSLRSRL